MILEQTSTKIREWDWTKLQQDVQNYKQDAYMKKGTQQNRDNVGTR